MDDFISDFLGGVETEDDECRVEVDVIEIEDIIVKRVTSYEVEKLEHECVGVFTLGLGFTKHRFAVYTKNDEFIGLCMVGSDTSFISNKYLFDVMQKKYQEEGPYFGKAPAFCLELALERSKVFNADGTLKIQFTPEEEAEYTDLIYKIFVAVTELVHNIYIKTLLFCYPYKKMKDLKGTGSQDEESETSAFSILITELFDPSQGLWTKTVKIFGMPVKHPLQRILYVAAERAGFRQAMTGGNGRSRKDGFVLMTKNANILLVGQSTIEENDGNMIFVNGDVLLYRQNKDGVEIEDYTIVVYGKER